MEDAQKKHNSIVGMCEIHQMLSSLDEVNQSLSDVKKGLTAPDVAEIETERLFAVIRSNANELDKTVSRIHNELVDMGMALDNKLNHKNHKEQS